MSYRALFFAGIYFLMGIPALIGGIFLFFSRNKTTGKKITGTLFTVLGGIALASPLIGDEAYTEMLNSNGFTTLMVIMLVAFALVILGKTMFRYKKVWHTFAGVMFMILGILLFLVVIFFLSLLVYPFH